MPDPDAKRQRIVLEGEVPDPSNPPSGCHFNPRCRYAVDVCRTDSPPLEPAGDGHYVACHRARELGLRGLPDLDELPVGG